MLGPGALPADERFDPEPPAATENRRAGWVLVAVGVILFELTASAALGAAVACLKFGLEDARTALWLRRRDPDRRRGRAAGWMYVAAGLGKVTIAAFAVSIAGVMLAGLVLGRPDAADKHLVGVMFLFLGGVAGLELATLWAVIAALRAPARVWLGRDIHRARRADAWPPWAAFRGGENRLRRLLLPVICLGYTIGLIATMIALLSPPPAPAQAGFFVALAIGGQVGGAVLILVAWNRILGRIEARTPREAWPEEEPRPMKREPHAWWADP